MINEASTDSALGIASPTSENRYTYALMVLPFFAIPLLIGCGHDKAEKLPPKPAAQQLEWEDRPLANAPTTRLSTPVKEGAAPLVYMAEGPGVARVVDRESGRTLAQANVVGGTIISVTPEGGILIGKSKYVRGPLDARREYVIYLDTGDGSGIRAGTLKATGGTRPPEGRDGRDSNAPPPRPTGP